MPRKKKAVLTLACSCGNTGTFNTDFVEVRQVFGSNEKVQVGSVDSFTIDVVHPIGHQVEFICKNCGTTWKFVRVMK